MDRFIWGRWELLICGVEVVDAVDAAEVMVARRRLDVRVEIVTSNRRTRTRFSLMSGAGIYIMENDGGYILRIGGVRNVAKSGGVTLIVYLCFVCRLATGLLPMDLRCSRVMYFRSRSLSIADRNRANFICPGNGGNFRPNINQITPQQTST